MIDFKYIDSLPDALTELYAQVETDILNDMAERINAMDFFNASVQWQEQKLQQMGLTHNLIVRKLSQLTGKTETELTKLINQAGAQVLASNAWLADAGYNLASVSASEKWKARITAGLKKTSLLFTNLTQTTAYATDSAFGQALDRAYMQIESGAFSRTEAVRNAVKDLSAKGLRTISYFDMNTGELRHTDNVDVAVRRAVLTGVNQTTAELQLTVNEELGLDLVEVSAHAGARPSHAEWQGRIYSLSGKSTKYPDFRSATGYGTGAGLCGWNCRHTFYPWAEGSSRVWSDQELAKLEEATVEYNGGKYTEYEASQLQRGLERAIRKYKREASALKSAGQPNQAELAKASQYNAKLNDFCKQTGYKKQYDRTYVVSGQISKTPPAPAIAPVQKVASKATTPQKAVANVVDERKYKLVPDSLKPENIREGLRDKMTAYLKTIEGAYDNAPEEFRKVWEKYIPSGGLIGDSSSDDAYFMPYTGKVYYSWQNDNNNPRGNGVTYFHEHGHALDWKAGQASLRDEFKKALRTDYKNAREATKARDRASQDFNISLTLRMKPDYYNGVSDIMGGLSRNKANGKWTHETSYWTSDSNNAYAEAWAHMTEAVFFEGQRNAIKEYFPTAWEVFNDIIKTL